MNGAQTTGSLANLVETISPDLQIAIRFVKAKKDSIIANIVRYNNSQTNFKLPTLEALIQYKSG